MPNSINKEGLEQSLREVARPADRVLRRRRARLALVASTASVAPLVIVVPLVYLILVVLLRLSGRNFYVSWWWVTILALLLPVAKMATTYLSTRSKKIAERTALSAIDDELKLHDRLSAAHEFLSLEETTPFMKAAIEDAQERIAAARNARLHPEITPLRFGAAHAFWGIAAIALVVLSSFVGVAERQENEQASLSPVEHGIHRGETNISKRRLEPPPRPQQDPPREPPRADEKVHSKRGGGSEDIPADKKDSKGEIGLGKSAQARSVGGQSSGEGTASTQAQPTKGGSKKTLKKSPKKSKPPTKKQSKKPASAPDEKESVASAGRGRGKGSSRSPTASDWSSKDQIVTDEEEEFDEDEDVDDDEEESDARGGLQPHLRQRKPPVNRDLNIGFGGGKPPPFANGRGGPGMPKKQRGVAQLVLGVPFPDHIAGQPNPGMTKVTQERIEPQSTKSSRINAEARRHRKAPMGRLKHRVLLPWMQDLIREFYDSLNSQSVKE